LERAGVNVTMEPICFVKVGNWKFSVSHILSDEDSGGASWHLLKNGGSRHR